MNKRIVISNRKIWIISSVFLALPTLVFFIGFLKVGFAIISCIALLVSFIFSLTTKKSGLSSITITITELVVIIIVALLWTYLGGQGGLFYQTSDWNERNAIFRDLIRFRWPVYYSVTNTVLSYYIGHWLPAAVVGKIIYLFSGNIDIAWKVGNIALWIWTTYGVFISFLLLIKVVKAKSLSKRFFALIIMIFFSGADILGAILFKWKISDYLNQLHIEWWAASEYQFSSITTSLFWVFNQAVPAWVALFCLLNENDDDIDIRNYGFIFITTLLCSPLPCVGLFLYMLAAIIKKLLEYIKERSIKNWFRELFSFGNCVMVLLVFPFIGAFLMSNSAVGGTSEDANAVPAHLSKPYFIVMLIVFIIVVALLSKFYRSKIKVKNETIKIMTLILTCIAMIGIALLRWHLTGKVFLIFLVFEVGLYLLILFPFFNDDYYYYITVLLLGIAPLIYIGIGKDFCMRASIPGIVMIVVYCVKNLENYMNKWTGVFYNFCRLLIVVLLIIGLCTPCMEIFRGFYQVNNSSDKIYTLDKYHKSGGIYGNFVSDNYETSLFFSIMSKVKKGDE